MYVARVVDTLWHPAGDVDAVRRCKRTLGLEVEVEERRFDHGLAIVKRAFHLERPDVGPGGGELLLLNLANSALRVQDDDVDVGHIQEALSHRTPGVSTGGNKNGQSLVAHPFEDARQVPRPNIFEGVGGAVKEFQRVDVVLDFMEVQREVEHVLEKVRQLDFRQDGGRQRSHHRRTQLPRLQVVVKQPQRLGQLRDVLRIVQPLSGASPSTTAWAKSRSMLGSSQTTIQHGLLGSKVESNEGDGPTRGRS